MVLSAVDHGNDFTRMTIEAGRALGAIQASLRHILRQELGRELRSVVERRPSTQSLSTFADALQDACDRAATCGADLRVELHATIVRNVRASMAATFESGDLTASGEAGFRMPLKGEEAASTMPGRGTAIERVMEFAADHGSSPLSPAVSEDPSAGPAIAPFETGGEERTATATLIRHAPVRLIEPFEVERRPASTLDEKSPLPVEVIHMAALRKEDEEEKLSGKVRLKVRSEGELRVAVNFLFQLRQQPQIRLLEASGNPLEEDVDVTVGLRAPLDLRKLLARMDGVLLVTEGESTGETPTLNVSIAEIGSGRLAQPGAVA